MKPEAAEVLKIALHIRDIEQEIESLQEQKVRAEYRLDQLVVSRASVVDISVAQPETARRGRVASETSAKNLIANLLNERPAVDFDAEMVASELNLNVNTVRTNLSRLKGENLIEKRLSNKYGAIKQEKEAPKEEAS